MFKWTMHGFKTERGRDFVRMLKCDNVWFQWWNGTLIGTLFQLWNGTPLCSNAEVGQCWSGTLLCSSSEMGHHFVPMLKWDNAEMGRFFVPILKCWCVISFWRRREGSEVKGQSLKPLLETVNAVTSRGQVHAVANAALMASDPSLSYVLPIPKPIPRVKAPHSEHSKQLRALNSSTLRFWKSKLYTRQYYLSTVLHMGSESQSYTLDSSTL